MIAYSVITAVMLVRFLSPNNRRIAIDFANRRMTVGKTEAPFDQVSLVEQASVRGGRGRQIPRARLLVTIGTRTFVLLDLSNDAAHLPGALANAIREGEVESLERETTRAGSEQGKKFIMTLVLMLVPGLMFAYAAIV
jgi:hypothetical protein